MTDTQRLDWLIRAIRAGAKVSHVEMPGRVDFYRVEIVDKAVTDWHDDARDAIDRAMEKMQ